MGANKKFFPPINEESSELNMTPLLDVLFVLLVLFILIAPLLKVDRIQLVSSLQEAKNIKTANFRTQSSLVIEVDKNNQVWVNEKKIKIEELSKVIQSMKISKGTIPILLQDKKSEFGYFETIKMILESLEFQQLDIILN